MEISRSESVKAETEDIRLEAWVELKSSIVEGELNLIIFTKYLNAIAGCIEFKNIKFFELFNTVYFGDQNRLSKNHLTNFSPSKK